MKLIDILRLDCTEKENKKILMEKFRSIPYVRDNYEGEKITFDNVYEMKDKILSKYKFEIPMIFYHSYSQTGAFVDKNSGQNMTIYSKHLKELFIKAMVYAYYYRRRERKKNER